MFASPYAIYFWSLYVLGMSVVVIWSGTIALKWRSGLTRALFISAVFWGLFSCLSQAGSLGWQWGLWGHNPLDSPNPAYERFMEITWGVSTIAALAFHITLLLYALRGSTESKRIAELEALLGKHMEAAVKLR